MKQMNILNKKKAMTNIEITISLALILLFFSMVFPSLKMSLKLEKYFLYQERLERNSSRIIEMLEKEIESSDFGGEEYTIKNNLINGKGIFEIPPIKSAPPALNRDSFKNVRNRGNSLFLEIPYVKNGKVYSKYFVYRFTNSYFYVYEYKNSIGNILLENGELIFDYVNGYFEWDKTGIKIVMNVKKEEKKVKELRGYALKGRKK